MKVFIGIIVIFTCAKVGKHRFLNKVALFKSLKEEWDENPPACIN